MSSYGHSLVPKHRVQVQKIANIGLFARKPYLKGVDRDRKFCLVEILKTAWCLDERTFHIEKREKHYNGKKKMA